MGRWAAQCLHEAGGKVVAVSERAGGVYNEAGLDITALWEHKRWAALGCLTAALGGG